MRSIIKPTILTSLIIIGILSCKKEEAIDASDELATWTAETHGPFATPNYTQVFPQDKVQRLDIVIDAEYWEVMQADLDDIMASTGGGPGQPPTFSDESPMYVPCQVFHDDKQWHDVGIRYKGNSSLNSSYQQGIGKLPLRLEFDHFADENPLLWGQSFYGFKQLSMGNNFKDVSFLREKVATDLYREFGVPCAHTAFYQIYVDYGEGPVYFGLYTMVEIVFDTMIDDQFASGEGNCYKPDGDGARINDPNTVTAEFFINKTNEGAPLTDIEDLVDILLDGSRLTNPAQWRSDLESVFDVDMFLKWLAANTTMQNWDTYGRMTHNYYLYNNPANNKLTWIPWDNNETFQDGPGGGGGPGGMSALEFDFSNLMDDNPGSTGAHTWPLINYLYNDTVYRQIYDDYIFDFINGPFAPSKMASQYTEMHNLVSPYVIGNNGEIDGYTFLTSESDFTGSLQDLIDHCQQRYSAADNYLQ